MRGRYARGIVSTAPARSPRPFLRLRGRSFMAMVLMPDAPLDDWMAQLDGQLARSPRFFDDRPVVLDLEGLAGQEDGFAGLLEALAARAVRVIGIENVDAAVLGSRLAGLPPVLSGGRTVGLPVLVPGEAPAPEPVREAPSLLIDQPVRSGQSVTFPTGDVTVLGSIASGAEVIAGGSIHVYGALRGRAIAGLLSGVRPRIFCRRLEAELLAIDGVYRTADEMDPALMGRAVQAWRDGDRIAIAAIE